MRIEGVGPAQAQAVETFLSTHWASSMILRSNARAAGFVDDGRRFSGAWFAAWDQGEIVGVVSHAWSGNLILQAPIGAAPLAEAAVTASGRPVQGLIGPWGQVCDVRSALNLMNRHAPLDSREELFLLELADLAIPAELTSGKIQVRRAIEADLPVVIEMRIAYEIETNRRSPKDAVETAQTTVPRMIASGDGFVACVDGKIAAISTFNARVPDVVQIGGVFTPPERRGQRLARACVAGSLQIARSEGVSRSVLFTGEENIPAQRAYLSIGFHIISDYGLVLFATQAKS